MAKSVYNFKIALREGTNRTVEAKWQWEHPDTDYFNIVWQYCDTKGTLHEEDGSPVDYISSLPSDKYYGAEFNAPDDAVYVNCRVRPVCNVRTDSDGNEYYLYSEWTWVAWQTYYFAYNPPGQMSAPEVSIDKQSLTIICRNFGDVFESSADWTKYVRGLQYQVFKVENELTLSKEEETTLASTSYKKYTISVEAGYEYVVRCRAYFYNKSNSTNRTYGSWSDDSSEVASLPSCPSITKVSVLSENTVSVSWKKVGSAKSYKIQLILKTDVENSGLTKEQYFKTVNPDTQDFTVGENLVEKDGLYTTNAITNLSGSVYYIRICSTNSSGSDSEWSNIESFSIGTTPTAPTTWSSTNSVVYGEPLQLYWTHNSEDGSISKKSVLHLKLLNSDSIIEEDLKFFIILQDNKSDYIGYYDGVELVRVNKTDPDEVTDNTYRCEVNTSHNLFRAGYAIEWYVATAGVQIFTSYTTQIVDGVKYYKYVGQPGDTIDGIADMFFVTREYVCESNGWSTDASDAFLEDTLHVYIIYSTTLGDNIPKIGEYSISRKINIYSSPVFSSMVLKDFNGVILNANNYLTSYPLSVQAEVAQSTNQHPVSYHVNVVTQSEYTIINNLGEERLINSGSSIYSKNFDISDNILDVSLSASDIDIEPGILYTVKCIAFMSSGLKAEASCNFIANWIDYVPYPNCEIEIHKEDISAVLSPYVEASYVDDVLLSVYRIEFDGTYKAIIEDVDSWTSVKDPHPSLDYARYRIIAKSISTGAISYTDTTNIPIQDKNIIIQWAEKWKYYNEEDSEDRITSESILKIPYNINISNNHSKDVSLVKYAGRQREVSYYGTHRGESASWSFVFPKSDVETLYAIRRLAIWMGDVYVREPSGTGYWASISVSYSQSYDSPIIPVSISVTPVEGGI